MDHTDKVKAAEALHRKAREFRGRFLNSVAIIERDLALILTWHFCREEASRQEMFFDEIACKFSLERKRELVAKLLQADFPAYWAREGKGIQDLQQLQSVRNKLAHSVVDVSEAALSRPQSEGVGFVQLHAGKPISEADLDDLCVRAGAVSAILDTVKRLVPYGESAGA